MVTSGAESRDADDRADAGSAARGLEDEPPGTTSTACRTPLKMPAGGGHRASEASVRLGSPGLVHTGTSDTWDEERRRFELLRRLSRMRRRTITGARIQLHELEQGGFRWDAVMVTLTYRPGCSWKPRHMSEVTKRMRAWALRRRVRLHYRWVAEAQTLRQQRTGESAEEVLHYHLLVWVPVRFRFPKPDKQGWWPHGSTRIELAWKPVGYLAKYASKGHVDSAIPKGARISGGGGLLAEGRRELAWWMLPRYVREVFPVVGQIIRRERGGGWFNWDEGLFLDAVGWSGVR